MELSLSRSPLLENPFALAYQNPDYRCKATVALDPRGEPQEVFAPVRIVGKGKELRSPVTGVLRFTRNSEKVLSHELKVV